MLVIFPPATNTTVPVLLEKPAPDPAREIEIGS
jgi:hypothetical protein